MEGFALYVHVPFCTVKCGYCDFNAYAGLDRLKGPYAGAVIGELRAWAPALEGRRVSSIAFGGGTPGEMDPGDIGGIIAAVRALWRVDDDSEVGLEANPGTSNRAQLAAFVAAGINRVSFGAQSFFAADLRFLDRIHSPEAIGASVRAAREAGVTSVGLDLLYGLPGQTEGRWREVLERALALEPDHVSCYALTVEPGTALAAATRRGRVRMPAPEQAAGLYDLAAEVLGRAGLLHYELSNWARPGHESGHNLSYWTDRPYLGVGAGAHGYLNGVRYENVADPRSYVAIHEAGLETRHDLDLEPGGLVAAVQRPSREAAMVDYIALRLRLVEGMDLAEFRRRWDVDLADVAGRVLADASDAGLLHWKNDRLALSRRGRLLHSELVARFMAVIEGA